MTQQETVENNPVVTPERPTAEAKSKPKLPKQYKVVIHNDDFTPMQFVAIVIIDIFGKNVNEAFELTMQIHQKGRGIAGVYTKDIAITKRAHVERLAAKNDFPLLCTVED